MTRKCRQLMPVLTMTTALVVSSAASAEVIDFGFLGNGGVGLLPSNEVGANTPVAPGADPSSAFGGERNLGLLYDTVSNELAFDFEIQGLSGGLANVASGIHLHLANPGTDPFNETGGIAFNLNSGTDANVTLDTPTIAFGSASGVLAGTAFLTEAQEANLFAGRYYLNIHSGSFGGGELRGNLVPEPSTVALVIMGSVALIRRSRG